MCHAPLKQFCVRYNNFSALLCYIEGMNDLALMSFSVVSVQLGIYNGLYSISIMEKAIMIIYVFVHCV